MSTLPLWGSLEKATDSDQTIDEAITAAIAAHNADTEAHLGSGQSLEAHKTQEIIDHPQSSVLPDKIPSTNRFLHIPTFPASSLDTDEVGIGQSGPIITAYNDTGHSGTGTVQLFSFIPEDFLYNDGDVVVDFSNSATGASGTWVVEYNFGFGAVQLHSGEYRYGYYDSGWTWSSWASSANHLFKRWRFFYDAGASELSFIKDGVLLETISSYILDLEDDEFSGKILLDRGTASTVDGSFLNISIAFDVTSS